MKCPYTIDQTMQTNTDHYSYDENGACTLHRHTLVEQRDLMECLKENCAAWRDNRCEYRGAVN